MNDYDKFLQSKALRQLSYGKEIDLGDIHPKLFPFQKDVVRWAVKKGRCAIFLDTGLGKTFVQLEWARLLGERTLIIAPLSVARQTVREAKKIDLEIKYVRSQYEIDEVNPTHKLFITNYEMIDNFIPETLGAIVLDESSILKSLDGVTRRKLIDIFQGIPYRLCCTATPAPNDLVELGNHAEFLGVMKANEMQSSFFIHANKVEYKDVGDGRTVKQKQGASKGQEWRLRNHGKQKFFEWLASWAISLRKPSDLGYSDDGYILPELNIKPLFVDVDYVPEGQLFFTGLHGIQDRNKVRKTTLEDRVKIAAELINNSKEQWLVWTGLQAESDAMEKVLDGSVQIQGSDKLEYKIEQTELFQDKKTRVLITKPKISGFGMNFQNCHNMIFVGLSDSWEAYYQCIRRCYRFGQEKPVNAYIVLSEVEREIYNNVMQKEKVARGMAEELIKHVKELEKKELKMTAEKREEKGYQTKTIEGQMFKAMLGDSCERLKELEDESIHLSVYSPPFADLYTYSASERDLGNSKDWDEFFNHYKFIIRELLRVTKPGRLTCAHVADIPAMSVKDGYMGMKDFPGHVITAYENEGWIYWGYAVVAKNPQAQAIRTKAHALLFATLRKDSAKSRPAILDRVLFFLKPGENEVPVKPVDNGEMNNETWIDWAGGIWTGIQESDTLQYTTARDVEDEKHVAPLQLGTIERCIKLYSNPGETVLTPFMGIGSEAYTAIRFGRKAIGIELKESYYRIAVKNLKDAETRYKSKDLFSMAGLEI